MRAAAPYSAEDAAKDRQTIAIQLETLLSETRLRHLHFADFSVAPPPCASITTFPRLSLILEGFHAMELPVFGRPERIAPSRGEAIFVPGQAWNRPDWTGIKAEVKVVTFSFGAEQIGMSLDTHHGGGEISDEAIKTSVHCAHDIPCRNILSALAALEGDTAAGRLSRLLTESLLHSCLRLLRGPERFAPRKAMHTYEMLCGYVQENLQHPLTREAAAQRFGIAPTHVSRLFRREGSMRFNDYVNLVRMNRAKFMLANYEIPLKEVAASCGYSDLAYFCRVFKRIAKATPTQYRDRRMAFQGSAATLG